MKNFNIKKIPNLKFGGNEYFIESEPNKPKSTNIFVKLVLGGIIGFVNGFWGGGGGMICVPMLTNIIKLPEKNAHATTLLIMLPLSIASLVVYYLSGNIDFPNAIKISIGFVLGGVLGAVLLKKISNVWLGIIFSIIIIAGGIKLLI